MDDKNKPAEDGKTVQEKNIRRILRRRNLGHNYYYYSRI